MKVRITKKDIIILLLLIPFIIPDSLIRFTIINNVVKVWKIAVGLWSVYYIFRKRAFSVPLVCFSVFYIIITLSGIIKGNFSLDWLMHLSFLWFINYSSEQKKLCNFLNVYIILGSFTILINLLTILLYPEGLYATAVYELNWFLGYKNVIIRKIMPVLVAIFVIAELEDRKLKKLEKIVVISALLTMLLSQSVNGLMGILIFFGCYFLVRIDKFPKWISLTKVFICYVAFDVILFNIGDLVSRYEYAILDLLKRNGTMSARIAIWNRSLQLIIEAPLLGYGDINPAMYNFSFKTTHPHNLLLYYWMLGGIVCIIVFVYGLFAVGRQCKISATRKTEKVRAIFMASYVAYFAMGLLESLVGAIFFIPFMLLMYNLDRSLVENDRNMYTI